MLAHTVREPQHDVCSKNYGNRLNTRRGIVNTHEAIFRGGAPVVSPQWQPKFTPWMIGVVVAMAAFMEVLDTSIANVALAYIGGAIVSNAPLRSCPRGFDRYKQKAAGAAR